MNNEHMRISAKVNPFLIFMLCCHIEVLMHCVDKNWKKNQNFQIVEVKNALLIDFNYI